MTLGNGATYTGASLATAVGPGPAHRLRRPPAWPAPIATAARAVLLGDRDNGGTPVLDPAKVAGKIVVCDRGVNARVDKSLAVQEAGGVGMVLRQRHPELASTPTSTSSRPCTWQTPIGAAVKAYAATAGATATISQATLVFNAPAPFTATFSSRGPLIAGGGDLLKPDVIAPGQDILAAVSPAGNSRPSTSTCSAARRCPRRTSPASRRCSRSSTRTGRRWRSSRR